MSIPEYPVRAEQIPNLTPPICPNCEEKGTLVERDRQTTERIVLGFNDEGWLEYGPTETLDGGDCHLICTSCWNETVEDEVGEATFDEDDDG